MRMSVIRFRRRNIGTICYDGPTWNSEKTQPWNQSW